MRTLLLLEEWWGGSVRTAARPNHTRYATNAQFAGTRGWPCRILAVESVAQVGVFRVSYETNFVSIYPKPEPKLFLHYPKQDVCFGCFV